MAPRRKRRYFKLTERLCERAGPGWHGDGLGLYLDVRPSGSRAFVQRIVINGRRRDIGLGGFPVTTLAAAREAAIENCRLRDKGIDPLRHRSPQIAVPTVRELFEVVIESRKRSWRGSGTEASWRREFDRYVFPFVGDTPVDCLTIHDVSTMVEPHWEGRNSVGYSVRQRLDVVLRRAVVMKYRADNPAHDLLEVLVSTHREPRHRPSVPHAQLRPALEALRASSAPEVVKDCLCFIALTAVRSAEATGAVWSEIDVENSLWTIPKSRMKAGHEHCVPLSRQALEIVYRARDYGGPFVFPFRPPGGNVGSVSGESLLYWLKKLGLRDRDGRPAVVHGLRASFRSWMPTVPHFPDVAGEAALAHRGSPIVRAYLRDGEFFSVRADLMQAWADYVMPDQSS